MFRLWCILIGYAFGLIQCAYILSKIKGRDLRKEGSGNLGTTNTLRVFGKRAAGICLAGDMLKTFAALVVTYFLFRGLGDEYTYLVRIYTALGVILGHDFPFYLKFKGGKGIACTGAAILGFYRYMIPGGVVIFFGIYFMTRFVSLAGVFTALGFLIQVCIFGFSGFLGVSGPLLYELIAVTSVISFFDIFSHRSNLERLARGNERKTFIVKKEKNDV